MPAMTDAASPALVGREPELDALTSLFDQTANGPSAVAVLVGEAGVGKTSLARALLDAASRRGAIALWGAAYDDWSPPYGPWAAALVSYLETIQADDEHGRAVSSDLVESIASSLGSGHRHPTVGLDSRDERARLHDAVSRLLSGAPRRVVLCLDDLHWADRPSLELLLAAARTCSGALFVVTVRDEDLEPAVASCLAELTRTRLGHRIDVSPLDQDSSAALLDRFGLSALAPEIFARAQGNPFFTEELARHVERRDADWAIPATVRLAVRSRVARLSTETARAVALAAVFTHPFSFAALAELTELDEETLLDALDEALGSGLLRVAAADREAYEFSHALVREALYEEMNPSRRARLHRRAAHAIEVLGGGRDLETATELATQYHRSAALPGAEHGVVHALSAADMAEERFARADTARLLRIARDLSHELQPARRAAILGRLALAEADALELDEARRTAADALDTMAEAGSDDDAVADFLWSLAKALRDAGAPPDHVRPLVERGLELVGDRRDIHWARLALVLRPAEPLVSGRITAERWLGYDAEAVAIARASDVESDYAATLELMDWRERDESAELLDRCRRWTDPAARIHALSIVARTLLYFHGAFREARSVSEELLRQSEATGSLTGAAFALEQIADVEIAFGDFEPAREKLARSREIAAALGPAHRLHLIVFFVETRLETFVGPDWIAIARRCEEVATDPRTPWPWITILSAGQAAHAYARADEPDRALRLVDELLPVLEQLPPTTLNQHAAVPLVGDALWVFGDASRAARVRRLAHELVAARVGDYVRSSSALTIAQMSSLLGEEAEAEARFAQAQHQLRDDGRRPLALLGTLDEALATARAGRRPAVGELKVAADELDSLGMTPWSAQARSLLEAAASTPPAGLTGREVEVLRLVADGRTNREIADRLVLSVHTVERHLANCYRKIGARNRSDATAFALRYL
jgi:DNA-binding CsgD family transcriptional regulator